MNRLLLLPPQLLDAQQEVQLGQLAALQKLPESEIVDKKVNRLLLLPPQLLHAQQEVQLGQLAALQKLPESEIEDKK